MIKTVLIALAITGVAFASGAKFGQWAADGANAKVRLEDARQTAAALTFERDAAQVAINEREQCRAEITKFNEATTRQAERVTQVIVADQARRGVAEQRAIVRERQSQARLNAAFSTLDELRRQIDAGAFQGCANERVGAELVGMLNSALGSAEGNSNP